MKRCLVTSGVIAVLYFLNRFWMIPHTAGILHALLSWYGADLLAGALMLCVLNGALIAANRDPLRRLGWASLFLLGCGLFWEVITPLYLPRSVGDPWDLLAYWLGGILTLLIESGRGKEMF